MYDVIVIGGGASGMMAAGRAAHSGARVLLLEKNRTLGKKLAISGGGRCNITNAQHDVRTFLKAYGSAEQFLYAPFAQFGVTDTFSFFEKLGLPLVVQARSRAFPHTEKAADVCAALAAYMKKGKVEVRTGASVQKVEVDVQGNIGGVVVGNEMLRATTYIFATGSLSHPETGSTGDGFSWLRALGHTVVEPTPAIVPLAVEEEWSKLLSGTSLENMKIAFYVDGTRRFAKKGRLLFTHFGISGPLVLNSAAVVRELLYEGVVTAGIDIFPDIEFPAVDKKILAAFEQYKNKALKNVVKEFVPAGMHPGIVELLRPLLDVEKKVHLVTKEERRAMIHLLKALPLTIVGLMGLERAVVADGGVPLKEIDTKTMRSRKVSNLFVTGDLLHINRPSGGYSLQLCWTTGYVAGEHCSQ
jgi:predicted Rossmann fold flavoprotein